MQSSFLEHGDKRRFTWRTISTWYYRYKNYGITGMSVKDRSDKGKIRKISPEELLEAINQVKPFFNELWQADTMFGPYVKDQTGKMIQTKLIAFIDDASRVICHAQFFFNENIDALITAVKAAFYKRVIPKQLYVDNGSIYCSAEITLICARVGCILLVK